MPVSRNLETQMFKQGNAAPDTSGRLGFLETSATNCVEESVYRRGCHLNVAARFFGAKLSNHARSNYPLA